MITGKIQATAEQIDRLIDDIRKLPAEPVGNHLSDSQFNDYVFENLTDEQEEFLDKHLKSCSKCASEMEQKLEMSELQRADILVTERRFAASGLREPLVIAVLPKREIIITDETKDENGILQFGMVDQLNNWLSRSKELTVRAMPPGLNTGALMSDPIQAAEKLAADFVLVSDMELKGENVSATARLTSVKDGEVLWEKIFSRKFKDISGIESSISKEVLQRLNLKLLKATEQSLTKSHSENPDADRSYKLGRFYLSQFPAKPLDKAIDYFEEAIKSDETFAAAYAGLADCFAIKGVYNIVPPWESFKIGLEYAEKALKMDATLPQAHTSLAYVNMCYRWDWQQAEDEYKQALLLNPNDLLAHRGYAHLSGALGKFDEALRQSELALRIDPASPMVYVVRGFIYYYAGDFEQSRKQFLSAIDINRHFDPAYYGIALASVQIALKYRERGESSEEKKMFEYAEKMANAANRYARHATQKQALQAFVSAMAGKKSEALKKLDELNEERKHSFISPYHLALVFTALAQPDEAIRCLEESFDMRDQWQIFLRYEPTFVNLRKDPRVQNLIRKLNFPATRADNDRQED